MAMLGQRVLIRTDLTFPSGLVAAQCSHLHAEYMRQLFLDAERRDGNGTSTDIVMHDVSTEFLEWIKDPYLFIHGVPNQEALKHFMKLGKEAGIPLNLWADTVYINLNGSDPDMKRNDIAIPDTLVGCTFGPCDSDKIKAIIGHLPLLK